ncbi:MAG TPA: D-alanyl-lipoteichoic acid biosynthesis protein DltD [Propionibacteriaceae bacterium]|nr:D-alanyl-lipoteichoic acid biosynthesis protein DltD [Propionibacteriaceae bacterium]
MRRVAALLAGTVLAIGLFLSPAADLAVHALTFVQHPEQRSVRVLNYESPGHREDAVRLYRQAIAGEPDGVTNLYVMGSSELGVPIPQNAGTWLPANASDFDMYESGRGNQQSLYHAVELGAVGPSIATKKVALILSPQWFVPGGEKASMFQSVFSHTAWDAMLANPHLSARTRSRLVARVGSLVPQLCTLGASCATTTASAVEEFVDAPYNVLTSRMNTLRDTYKGSEYRKAVTYTGPWRPGKQPMATIDWAAEDAKAVADGKAQVGRNPYNMEDSYYRAKIVPQLPKFKDQQRSVTFTSSVEYDDLQLFLDVAHDLGIQVLLIAMPVNGLWSDYTGLPKATRDGFSAKVRTMAAANGAQLVDLSSKAYEPYYFFDTLHLGWRGWLDVTRACWSFASS